MVGFILGTLIKILQDVKPAAEDQPEKVGKFNTTILTWVCGGVCIAGLLSILTLFSKEIGRRRKYKKLEDIEKTVLFPDDQQHGGSYGAI